MNLSKEIKGAPRLLIATLILTGIVVVSIAWSVGVHPDGSHSVCVAAVFQETACPDGLLANLTFHTSALVKYFGTTGIAAESLMTFLFIVALLGASIFRLVRPRLNRLEHHVLRFLRREFRRPPPLQDLGHWLARLELSPNRN